MPKPLPSTETPIAPPFEILAYAILTALLYTVSTALLMSGSKFEPVSIVLIACGAVICGWLCLIRPAWGILRGRLSARQTLLMGAHYTMYFFGFVLTLSAIGLISGATERHALAPRLVARALLYAATVAAAFCLGRRVEQLPSGPSADADPADTRTDG